MNDRMTSDAPPRICVTMPYHHPHPQATEERTLVAAQRITAYPILRGGVLGYRRTGPSPRRPRLLAGQRSRAQPNACKDRSADRWHGPTTRAGHVSGKLDGR